MAWLFRRFMANEQGLRDDARGIQHPEPSELRLAPDRFTYTPINTGGNLIRLIQVLSYDCNAANGIIRCRLRQATTDSAYTCLSYVWGAEGDVRDIELNGKLFSVRRNLWDLLDVASRSKDRDRNYGVNKDNVNFDLSFQSLWVDALCIDQENMREKNYQVQRMGQIYANAQCVVSWLGKNEDLHQGFARMAEFETVQGDLLTDLCSNVYWRRAWVTQEITLARDLCYLADVQGLHHETAFGNSLYVTPHSNADILLWKRQMQYRLLHKSGECPNSISELHDLARAHLQSMSTPREVIDMFPKPRDYVSTRSLIQNIARFSDKECFDQRDKIYSLLSISHDSSNVEVDYNISPIALAKRTCSRLGHLCPCKAESVESLFRAVGVDEWDDQAIFRLMASPIRIHDGKCSRCNTPINSSIAEDSIKGGMAFIYCLHCANIAKFDDFHICVVRSREQKERNNWRIFSIAKRETYEVSRGIVVQNILELLFDLSEQAETKNL
ncbi:heterokaryon incompatibility protein-domain-containing protein [Paraphoma chrysanthemicola]|nr:heterokaryon incompatibility protein-domain-containing protein [Paraphoma chrysanthemicola]